MVSGVGCKTRSGSLNKRPYKYDPEIGVAHLIGRQKLIINIDNINVNNLMSVNSIFVDNTFVDNTFVDNTFVDSTFVDSTFDAILN